MHRHVNGHRRYEDHDGCLISWKSFKWRAPLWVKAATGLLPT